MSTSLQEKFEKSKPVIIRHLITIGIATAIFTAITVFGLNFLTLLSVVGLLGTIAGVVYNHVRPQPENKGTFILKDYHFVEFYEDLYTYLNSFFEYVRKAVLLVNPAFTAGFVLSVYAIWKVSNHLGDFYTVWLICIGYPAAEIIEALFGPEIQSFRMKTSSVIRKSLGKKPHAESSSN